MKPLSLGSIWGSPAGLCCAQEHIRILVKTWMQVIDIGMDIDINIDMDTEMESMDMDAKWAQGLSEIELGCSS